MISFKQCAEYLIEKEGVQHTYDDKRRHYRNDKIELSTTAEDKEYSSVVISFLDETAFDKKNKVSIIIDRNQKDVHIVFDFENGDMLRIIIDHDREITFSSLDGKDYIKLDRMDCRMYYWFEPNPSRRARINLDDYDAKDVVENIRRAIVRNTVNPKFDRLFEIIRPILVLSILEVNINTVKKGLYGDIECIKSAIREIDEELAKKNFYEPRRVILENERNKLISKLEEIKDIIDVDQCSIYDEYEPFITKKR